MSSSFVPPTPRLPPRRPSPWPPFAISFSPKPSAALPAIPLLVAKRTPLNASAPSAFFSVSSNSSSPNGRAPGDALPRNRPRPHLPPAPILRPPPVRHLHHPRTASPRLLPPLH